MTTRSFVVLTAAALLCYPTISRTQESGASQAAPIHDVEKLRQPLLEKVHQKQVDLTEEGALALLAKAAVDDEAYRRVLALVYPQGIAFGAADAYRPGKANRAALRARTSDSLSGLNALGRDPAMTGQAMDGGTWDRRSPGAIATGRVSGAIAGSGGFAPSAIGGVFMFHPQSACDPDTDPDCAPSSKPQPKATKCIPGSTCPEDVKPGNCNPRTDPDCADSGSGSTRGGRTVGGERGGAPGGANPLPEYDRPSSPPSQWTPPRELPVYREKITVVDAYRHRTYYGQTSWEIGEKSVIRKGSDLYKGNQAVEAVTLSSQERMEKFGEYAYWVCDDAYPSGACRRPWRIVYGRYWEGYENGRTKNIRVEVKFFNNKQLLPWETERFDLRYDGWSNKLTLKQTKRAYDYRQEGPFIDSSDEYAYVNLIAGTKELQDPAADGLKLQLSPSDDRLAFKIAVKDEYLQVYQSEAQIDFTIRDARGRTVFGTSSNWQQIASGQVDLSSWKPWIGLTSGKYRLEYRFRRPGGKLSTENPVGPFQVGDFYFNPAVFAQVNTTQDATAATFTNQGGRDVNVTYAVKKTRYLITKTVAQGTVLVQAGRTATLPLSGEKGTYSIEFSYK